MMTKDTIGPAEAMRRAVAAAEAMREAAAQIVERWSLPTIQAPSMWLIDRAGIASDIRALPLPAPASEPTAEGREVYWKARAEQFQRERAELSDKLNGTPCAEICWQQERKQLNAELARMKAAMEG